MVFKPTLSLVSKTTVGQYVAPFVNMDFSVSEHRYDLQIRVTAQGLFYVVDNCSTLGLQDADYAYCGVSEEVGSRLSGHLGKFPEYTLLVSCVLVVHIQAASNLTLDQSPEGCVRAGIKLAPASKITLINSGSADGLLGQSMCSQVSSLHTFDNAKTDNEMALIMSERAKNVSRLALQPHGLSVSRNRGSGLQNVLRIFLSGTNTCELYVMIFKKK